MTSKDLSREEQRVAFLRSLAVLDTAPDENLDRIVTMCRLIFDMPVADISLVDGDRQWFKSKLGIEVEETSREIAICSYTIEQSDLYEITDASQDPVFSSNPLVVGEPGVRYYMGAPLEIEGYRIGSLCVMDTVPRPAMTPDQRAIMVSLADMVIREIEVQRLLRESLPLVLSFAAKDEFNQSTS